MRHRHPELVAPPPSAVHRPASPTTVPRVLRFCLFPDIAVFPTIDRTMDATP